MARLRRIDEHVWQIDAEARADMRVPARVFADERSIAAIERDSSLEQLQNVATLPGIVEAAIAMPDVHQGYGFPVGAVAATESPDGVVSPGGVGYDVNCGVRLLALPVALAELGGRRERLVDEIARRVPAGAGRGGALELPGEELDRVLVEGPRALVDGRGVGTEDDLVRTESHGRIDGADPGQVSERARLRGAPQLGTMGSGNHFVELGYVRRLHEPRFGLTEDGLTVLIHSGSRGLGHQVCTDFVKRMDARLHRYGIELPDRQLSCAPASSPDGRAYLAAMAAAANFAWANRQAIAHSVRQAVRAALGDAAAAGTRQVYDVAHNVAKLERHGGRELCVHRKGATRAYPGQAAFVPGSMGTCSFVLEGRPAALERSFGSVCHGAGRALSRTQARKRVAGAELRRELERQGIAVRCPSNRGLAEEAPFAYKDVEAVVEVVARAGLAARVAELRPVGVING